MKSKKKGPLEEAREVLDEIWRHCLQQGFVARGWGSRGKNSRSTTPGSNIILSDGQSVVIICQEDGNRYGKLVLMSFGPATLEEEVFQVLVKAGLVVRKSD